MKSILALILLFSVSAAQASGSQEVFSCFSILQMDEEDPTTMTFGVSIVKDGNDFYSFYVGSNEPGPEETEKQTLSLQESLTVGLVDQILNVVGLTKAQIKEIESVEVYTSGNIEDDLAGVRSAAFLDAKGQLLGSGMFFGWGGPHKCQ